MSALPDPSWRAPGKVEKILDCLSRGRSVQPGVVEQARSLEHQAVGKEGFFDIGVRFLS